MFMAHMPKSSTTKLNFHLVASKQWYVVKLFDTRILNSQQQTHHTPPSPALFLFHIVFSPRLFSSLFLILLPLFVSLFLYLFAGRGVVLEYAQNNKEARLSLPSNPPSPLPPSFSLIPVL